MFMVWSWTDSVGMKEVAELENLYCCKFIDDIKVAKQKLEHCGFLNSRRITEWTAPVLKQNQEQLIHNHKVYSWSVKIAVIVCLAAAVLTFYKIVIPAIAISMIVISVIVIVGSFIRYQSCCRTLIKEIGEQAAVRRQRRVNDLHTRSLFILAEGEITGFEAGREVVLKQQPATFAMLP